MRARHSFNEAMDLVQRIADRLAPSVERAAVVGSLARRRPLVGDGELLIIPKRQKGLFDEFEGKDLLRPQLHKLLLEGTLAKRIRSGPKWLTYEVPYPNDRRRILKLDLFVATRDGWAVSQAIRTGPRQLSKALVTQQGHGGLLPDGHNVSVASGLVLRGCVRDEQGNVIHRGQVVPFRDEREFFEFCSCGWIEPEHREEWKP